MRECPRCHVHSDDFYPDAAYLPRAICKGCINRVRATSVSNAVDLSERLLREQVAICSVIDYFQVNGEPYVYLLDSGQGFKIGFSSNVSKRVKSFNTAHSKPVKVIAVAPGGRQEEAELHRKFAPYRIAREWYGRRPSVLRAFRKMPGSMIFIQGDITTEAPATF